MPRNRNLTDLRNIGKKIAGRLNEVGIFSEGDLRQVGAAGAHTMIRDSKRSGGVTARGELCLC